jgi:hypothetical protein
LEHIFGEIWVLSTVVGKGFNGSDNPHLPHNHETDQVVYLEHLIMIQLVSKFLVNYFSYCCSDILCKEIMVSMDFFR